MNFEEIYSYLRLLLTFIAVVIFATVIIMDLSVGKDFNTKVFLFMFLPSLIMFLLLIFSLIQKILKKGL